MNGTGVDEGVTLVSLATAATAALLAAALMALVKYFCLFLGRISIRSLSGSLTKALM